MSWRRFKSHSMLVAVLLLAVLPAWSCTLRATLLEGAAPAAGAASSHTAVTEGNGQAATPVLIADSPVEIDIFPFIPPVEEPTIHIDDINTVSADYSEGGESAPSAEQKPDEGNINTTLPNQDAQNGIIPNPPYLMTTPL